jgi:hypothetical protein
MMRDTEEFLSALRSARRAATPLVAVRTADPASTIALVQRSLNGSLDSTPLVSWDVMTGVSALNAPGKAMLDRIVGDSTLSAAAGPANVLELATRLADDAILFYANPQRVWHDAAVVQGIWNLRDTLKSVGAALVLITPPGTTLPPELTQDVLVIDEPLPSQTVLREIVRKTFAEAGLEPPPDEEQGGAVDALLGLAAFPAEQVVAMSISKRGLDHHQLWERKRQVIEQAPGLTVWRGGETFSEVGGCANIKRFLEAVLNGIDAPRVIVFCDEIEKAFAGTGTDLSGVTTEMTGTILSWMQDREADGAVMLGPPGTAKSMISKAAGNTAGIPTIGFDLSAMKNGIVGSSGERLRTALSIIDAVSGGRSLWLATCNSIASLPPELRRRFTMGTFFFDLPSPDEREAIWRIYSAKFHVDGSRPQDDNWTGAEIKECCRKAYRLRMSLEESAAYIVPVARSASDQIESLRQQSSGKYISASHPGVYEYNKIAAVPRGRALRQLATE